MKVGVLLLSVFLILAPSVLMGGGVSEDSTSQEISSDGIAWERYSGTTLTLGMNRHAYTTTIKPLLNDFTKKTGIEVQVDEYAQDEFMTKRLVDLSSGAGTFDIVMMDSAAPQAAQAGWIENLDPWFEKEELVNMASYDLDDVSKAFRDSFTVDGNLYAIPVSGEKQILYYRKDIFKERNLTVPKTFEELYETAKLLKKDYSAGILLRGQKIHTVSNTTGLIWSYGGTIADKPINPTKAVFNSPEGVEGVDMYTTLAREFGPSGIGNYTWYECVSDFQQGKAPMYLDMSVFMSQFEDEENSTVAGKVGYAPMPAGPAGSKPTGPAWSLSINSASKNKEAAFLFLTWITNPENSKKIALDGGLAVRGTALSSPELADIYPADWLQAFKSALEADVPEMTFPLISKGEEYLDTIGTAFNSLILEEQDVKPVLDDAAEEVTELFQSDL